MSKDGKDWHAQGQQEAANSRDNNCLNEAWGQIFGGDRYNPPSDAESRSQYYLGIENAENNPPKK